MDKIRFKHLLGWYYLTLALAGVATMLFIDPVIGLLVVILTYVAKAVENTAILRALTEDPNNE